MTRYRDWDGTIRLIERRGATRGAATKALNLAIRDRSRASSGSDITPDTKVAVLAEQWFSEVSSGSLSPSTLEIYGDMLRRLIVPALGNLRVRELTVGSVDRHLSAVKVKHGPAVAKTDRTVLSGLCKLACRHDALGSNPCRETSRLSTKPKKPPTSLSVDEIRLLRRSLAEDQQAIEADIVDLVTLLMASGLRLGEALGRGSFLFEGRALTLQAGGSAAQKVRIKNTAAAVAVMSDTSTPPATSSPFSTPTSSPDPITSSS
jgi:integrase